VFTSAGVHISWPTAKLAHSRTVPPRRAFVGRKDPQQPSRLLAKLIKRAGDPGKDLNGRAVCAGAKKSFRNSAEIRAR
jgi:hypothetical protein